MAGGHTTVSLTTVAHTLKYLADQGGHNLFAHNAQLAVPQRVLQHLRNGVL